MLAQQLPSTAEQGLGQTNPPLNPKGLGLIQQNKLLLLLSFYTKSKFYFNLNLIVYVYETLFLTNYWFTWNDFLFFG